MPIRSPLTNYQNLILLLVIGIGLFLALTPMGALIALLISIGGLCLALAVLRYPFLLIPLLLTIAPTAAYEKRAGLPFIGQLSSVSTGQLLMAGTLAFYVGWLLVKKRRALPSFKLFVPLAIWLTFTLVSTLWADSRTVALREWFKWIEILLVIWITIDLFQEIKHERTRLWLLIYGILISGVVQGFIGITQFINPDGPESFLILGRFYRAFGTFEQPNPFGGFLGWHFLLAAGILAQTVYDFFFVSSTDQHDMQGMQLGPLRLNFAIGWMHLLLLSGAAAIIGAGIVASWSRGAWLALLAGLGAILFFLPRNRLVGVMLVFMLALAGVGGTAAGLVPDSIAARLGSATEFEIQDLRDVQITDGNYALYERLGFWVAAFNMTREHLWMGVGFGNYDEAYPLYFVNIWEQSLGHAHNYYINLLAETGILGLMLYVLFWCAIIFQNLNYLSQSPPFERGILVGLLGVWIAISTHHLVDKLYVNNIYLNLATFFALQELIFRRISQTAPQQSQTDL